MGKNVGIITYHSAYNFGSVLQAYATEKAIESLGYNAQILNYRMQSQYDYYSMLHTNRGVKGFIKDLLHLPQMGQYIQRKRRFEAFISQMNLTEEFRESDEALAYTTAFDVFISGSDQIWNKHSNELISVDWKYMDPYLLTFTSQKKVSYASSIVNMTTEELKRISDKIKEFDSISFREPESCNRLLQTAGIQSDFVLDPTLLLRKQDWEKVTGELPAEVKDKRYILYYALEGVKKTNAIMPALRQFAKRRDCALVMITPLSFSMNGKNVYNMIGAGPAEFLSLICHAELVLTNSYHGTLFSVNLGVPFYTLRPSDSKDNRIPSILSLLKLENRIVTSLNDIPDGISKVDFGEAWKHREIYRDKSILYLKKAIGGTNA